MRDFRELFVWQKAHQLVLEVYKATADFPRDERFGLTQQVRRSAASIATNIAEGCGRGGDPELARFLQISMGSASETEYHLLLASDLQYTKAQLYATLDAQVQEIKRMLTAFLLKLRVDIRDQK